MDVAAFEHWLGEIAALNLLYSGDRHGRRWHYPRLRTAMTVRLASLWVRALQALV